MTEPIKPLSQLQQEAQCTGDFEEGRVLNDPEASEEPALGDRLDILALRVADLLQPRFNAIHWPACSRARGRGARTNGSSTRSTPSLPPRSTRYRCSRQMHASHEPTTMPR